MNTPEIIALITIAAAMLQIILFFKLWGMTNDVRTLREKYTAPSVLNFKYEIRKLLCSGNKEKAKELLLNRFYENISNLNFSDIDKDGNVDQVKKNIDADFMKLKVELENNFAKIRCDLPERIKLMKSGNEFYELYK